MSSEAKKNTEKLLGGASPPNPPQGFCPFDPCWDSAPDPFVLRRLGKILPRHGIFHIRTPWGRFCIPSPGKKHMGFSQGRVQGRERWGSGLNCPPSSDFSLEIAPKGQEFLKISRGRNPRTPLGRSARSQFAIRLSSVA